MTTIRYITESDSEKYLELCKQLDQETQYMMFEPDERVMDVAQQTSQIREMVSKRNSMILVAEEGHKLVGYLSARGGVYRRTFHKVEGTCKDSLFIAGRYVDEYYMAKIL